MKAVTLYRPSVLENALSGFDRYLDSFFGDSFLTPADRIFSRLPFVDVRETEKAYVIEAELPGLQEKDIEIRLDSGNLTISSKKAEERAAEKEGAATGAGSYLIQERRVASFCRTFKLPENADRDGISASFTNGILSVEIQKKAEAQAQMIEISKT